MAAASSVFPAADGRFSPGGQALLPARIDRQARDAACGASVG
jgi:hypothetical protein